MPGQSAILVCFVDFFALLIILLSRKMRKERRDRAETFVSSGHGEQSTSIRMLPPPAHGLWQVRAGYGASTLSRSNRPFRARR